jgi:hypothetical protein
MRKVAIILGSGVLLVAIIAGYQIGACELADIELQDEMQDLASQLGTRIGLSQLNSDEELRSAVIRKAQQHGIKLGPEHVTVEHMGSGSTSTLHLAADYTAPINLPGFSFTLHFTPATQRKLLGWRTQGTFVAIT